MRVNTVILLLLLLPFNPSKCTVSSQKYTSPFLHTTLSQKWGGGVCLNIINFVSCIRPSRRSSHNLHDDCRHEYELQPLNTCAIDVPLRRRVVRERGYHVHEAICEASQRKNSICADPFTVAAAFRSK